MDINVSIPQAKKLAAKWSSLSIRAKSLAHQAFMKAGYAVERAAKTEEQRLIYDTPERGYVRTGRLQQTTTTTDNFASGENVSVGPHTNYAAYVNYGTYKMTARPFMENGIKNAKGDIDTIFKNLLTAIVQEMK